MAFVCQQLLRAQEDMETFRICHGQMREARATDLPSLQEQAQRCINRAVELQGVLPARSRLPSPV